MPQPTPIEVALFACDECGDLSTAQLAGIRAERIDGEIPPLGACAVVRETHDEETVCTGTVAFIGYVTAGLWSLAEIHLDAAKSMAPVDQEC